MTDKAGVPGTGFGLGSVWATTTMTAPDHVTQFGKNVLYHNNGNGTFTDVTEKAGVGQSNPGRSFTPAPPFRHDRDGRLDLYVGGCDLRPNSLKYYQVCQALTIVRRASIWQLTCCITTTETGHSPT